MRQFFKRTIAAPLLLLAFTTVMADPIETAVITKAVNRLMPKAKPDSITQSSIPGLYEVIVGTQVLYVSKDGKYVLEGDLYDIDQQKNLTEAKRSKGRAEAINKVSEDTMIIFAPKKVKHTITVFTDIDCGYCRKLHNEINDYLAKGIEIRYMSFPRSGVDTPSYYKAVSVWCSSDRKAAITKAKAGGKLEKKECDNPVKQHMAVAQIVGVTGTPTIVLADGKVVPGYVPAERLAQYLDANEKQ